MGATGDRGGCLSDEVIQGLLAHSLSSDASAMVKAHVDECQRCRELVVEVVRGLPTLDAGSGGTAAPRLPTIPTSTYDIEGEFARGGLGRILRAWDTRLGRTVALKELLASARHAEKRFVREALITARLEHPAVVPVHEAGCWPTGEPFYTMKLVSGQTLQQVIAGSKTLAARLALLPNLIAVAEAMAYAHSRSIIHRDLKPSNVLVGRFGETVVVDWGLAKDLRAGDEADPEPTARGSDGTLAGAVMGTPAYMAPEQARGEPVDERADVYALGAVLYELLAGVPPYGDIDGAPLDAVLKGPATPVDELQAGIPRDLVAVVRKAMSRAPQDRYRTADELAADLKHFQTGQLVSAREYSTWALATRWLRRHRLPVAVAAAALVVAATIGVVDLRRVLAARRAAEAAQRLAEARNHELILLQARALLDRDATASLAWLKQIPAEAPLWSEARAVAVQATSRGYARHVWRDEQDHYQAVFSPDGRWLVSCSAGERIRIHDVATGSVRHLEVPGMAALKVAFAADGTMVTGAGDGTLIVWPAGSLDSPATAQGRRLAPAPSGRTFVAISRDGRLAASLGVYDPTVTVFDLESGTARALTGGAGEGVDIAVSPDGRLVAGSYDDKVIRVWNLTTGTRQDLRGTDPATRPTFTPDGERLIVAEMAGIREWSLATGEGRLLPMPALRYQAVDLSPDGRTVAGAGFAEMIYLLDRESGDVSSLRSDQGFVNSLAFSPDGALLASMGRDALHVWALPEKQGRILVRTPGAASNPVFSPDGSLVAAGGGDGHIHLRPLGGGDERLLVGHTKPVFDVQFAPDGATLASQSSDQTVRLWDLATGASRVLTGTAAWVDFGRLRYSRDGRLLACSLDRQTLAVFDARTGDRVCTFGGPRGGFNLAHDFSPDGTTIAFTDEEAVMLGELATCASRALYRHDADKSAYMLLFSPDGRILASSSDDGTIGVYEVDTGRARRFTGHREDAFAIAFSPDGKTLVSGSLDTTVRLWDLATGAARELRGHELLIASVAFSPDGRTLASASHDLTIRLWDVATGAGAVLLGHRDTHKGIAFSPDSRWVVSGSRDGTVRLWLADARQDIPIEAGELKAWLERVTSTRIDARGRVTSPDSRVRSP